VIIVSQTGEVQNKIIEADEEINQDEFGPYSKYLSEIMGGLSLAEAKHRIMEELKKEKVLFDKLMFRALQPQSEALENEGEGNLFIEGQTNTCSPPNLPTWRKIRSLLQTFEEKTKIVRLLDKALSVQGIQISSVQKTN